MCVCCQTCFSRGAEPQIDDVDTGHNELLSDTFPVWEGFFRSVDSTETPFISMVSKEAKHDLCKY